MTQPEIEEQSGAPIHAVPPCGSGLMPCCKKTPFEVPGTDRITNEPDRVTCAVEETSTGPRRQGEDGELERVIAVALAEKYTSPAREGVTPEQRLDQGMMNHFLAADGFPAMAPVTPREAAEVVTRILREAGIAS